MDAATKLAQYGLTEAQALEWIQVHLDQPGTIYQAAWNFGLDSAMLAEIVQPAIPGVNSLMVEQYFNSNGLDGGALAPDQSPVDYNDALLDSWLPGSTDALFGVLENIVGFNTHTGILSNESIRAEALSYVDEQTYYSFFDPTLIAGFEDGVFTSQELGLPHLPAFSATAENLESLVYGTVINVFKAIDSSEVAELEQFLISNETALMNLDPATMDNFYGLIVDVFADPAATPLVSDVELAEMLALVPLTLEGLASFDSSLLLL